MKQQFIYRSLPFYLGIGLIFALFIARWQHTALADGGGVAVSLNAGGLAVRSNFNSNTLSVALNGQDQIISYTLPLLVTDATGSGGGWSMTITSTQFSTSGLPSYTLSPYSLQIVGVSVSCGTNSLCTNPSNTIGFPQAVPAAMNAPQPQKFFQAIPSTGMGTLAITPMLSILIPGKTYAGMYNSVVTLAVISGP